MLILVPLVIPLCGRTVLCPWYRGDWAQRVTMASGEFLGNPALSRHGPTGLDRLDLIGDGGFVVLVGPSGWRRDDVVTDEWLRTLDCGRIRIGGATCRVDPKDRDVAMVFPERPLPAHDGGAEHGLRVEGRKIGKAKIPRAGACRSSSDLHSYLDRKPKDLSGGQRQRVAMGRACSAHRYS